MSKQKEILITDSTHSIEKDSVDVIKHWKGNFTIFQDDKKLDITENVIYFKYAYMHSWFGYYFAISCLFSDDFVNANKDILEEHDTCKVTFKDSKGTFVITGKVSSRTLLSKQIPNSKNGNVSLAQWTCIYFSDILISLDKEPKITSNKYPISTQSVNQLLESNNIKKTMYFSKSFSTKADSIMYESQNSTVKNKSLREAILNIISNIKINDSYVSKLSTSTKTGNKQVKKVDSSIDDGYLYPFRIGVNMSGNNIFTSYYKDMIDKVNNTCALICSFTDGGLSNKCMSSTANTSGLKVYMSSPVTYSLENEYTDYILTSNKCFLEIDYSYQSTKLLKKHKLQDVLNLKNFFIPSQHIIKSNEKESKVFKFTTTYSDRQKCASTLFNAFYANVKYIFRNEEGLLPTTFFTFNNGNIIWSLVNLYHIAIINKVLKNSGTEVIKLPSQINGVIIEMEAYTGKTGMLTMTQYISLNRPALFPRS